jgi:transposase-like protein
VLVAHIQFTRNSNVCDIAADDMSGALMELLGRAKIEQVDFLREALHKIAQALMEWEVTQHLHTELDEQTDERMGYRNGHRERQWDIRVGTIQLHVPRVRVRLTPSRPRRLV